jgi:hypothetical protein
MSAAPDSVRWIAYSFAVLCVVPHPHLGTAIPIGVILHARTAQFIGIRVLTDPVELSACEPWPTVIRPAVPWPCSPPPSASTGSPPPARTSCRRAASTAACAKSPQRSWSACSRRTWI